MKKIIIKVSDFLDRLCKIIVTVLLMVCFLMILYQIFSRYVLQQRFMSLLFPQVDFVMFSFAWLEEAARLLFVWSIFLSIAIVTLNMGHAKVELVVERLPVKVRVILFYVVDATTLLFFVFFFLQSLSFIHSTKGLHSPLLGFSMGYLYCSITVGSAICIIHLIRVFIEGLGKNKKSDAITEGGN